MTHGGKRPGGRPRVGDAVVHLRASREQVERWDACADRDLSDRSTWIRARLDEADDVDALIAVCREASVSSRSAISLVDALDRVLARRRGERTH